MDTEEESRESEETVSIAEHKAKGHEHPRYTVLKGTEGPGDSIGDVPRWCRVRR